MAFTQEIVVMRSNAPTGPRWYWLCEACRFMSKDDWPSEHEAWVDAERHRRDGHAEMTIEIRQQLA